VADGASDPVKSEPPQFRFDHDASARAVSQQIRFHLCYDYGHRQTALFLKKASIPFQQFDQILKR
jgi:hypothetical protein